MRLIVTTDTVGGVWTFTRELATELLLRGHEIYLVSFGGAPSSNQREAAAALQLNYPKAFRFTSSEVPLEWMQTNGGAFDDGAKLLLVLDTTFRPDAYLFSQFCYGALPVDAPKVIIAHSDVLSWAAACGETLDARSKWMQTYSQIVRRGLSEADVVVSPTAAYLSDLRTYFPALSRRQYVIANGRNIQPLVSNGRRLQAVTAGRMWDKAKNLSLLLGAVPPMPLMIAGETSGAALQSSHTMQWMGQLGEPELLDLFRSSAVYLCTSVYEPFGLAPLEAALCGCAVVAMDLKSLREVWGNAALYFQDAEELSRLLKHLCEDPEALLQAQTRSGARAAAHMAKHMADQYLELLQSLTRTQREANTHAA